MIGMWLMIAAIIGVIVLSMLMFELLHRYVIYCIKDYTRYMRVKNVVIYNTNEQPIKAHRAYGRTMEGEAKVWDERDLWWTCFKRKLRDRFKKVSKPKVK